jgi:hypothetical protein
VPRNAANIQGVERNQTDRRCLAAGEAGLAFNNLGLLVVIDGSQN